MAEHVSNKAAELTAELTAEQLITENLDIWTSAIEQKSASGRGSSKKFSLHGIKKLRELILELAVRGKLVPQDEKDEPASVLLERIAAEKAQLVKDKKIKKPKALPEISEDEKPFDLPKGWEWTRLAELAEIGPRNSELNDDSEASFVPMPLITTSYKGSHGSETRTWKEIKKGYTHFADGDIALAKITPCFENSKAAVFSGLINGVGTGTTELHVARPIPDTLNPLFILLYLKAPMFLKVGETKMTGSAGQKRVPKDFFANNPLPFAPLEEQHRIVAKVDELMSLCDALEAQTEASLSAHQTLVETLLGALLLPYADANSPEPSFDNSPERHFIESWQRVAEHFDTLFTTSASIDTLKQTILQLAVMGKLVEQDANDEPAAKLLERIAAEKAQLITDKKIKKQKPLPAITDEEKPFNLPNGWEWVCWGDLLAYDDAAFKRGPFGSSLTKSMFINEGYKVYEQYCPINDDCSFERYYISDEKFEELKAFAVKAGDFLVSCTGATLGRITQVPPEFKEGVINQALIRVRINYDFFDAEFFKLLFRSPFFQRSIFANSKGSAIPNLKGVNDLKAMVIPFFSIKEQHRIVAKVDELMALCDQLKARLSDAQTTQLHLTDAIVEQAV